MKKKKRMPKRGLACYTSVIGEVRMDMLKIRGGRPLEGRIRATGAKNAVSKMLVASLLSDQPCLFFNVPNIAEVEITVNLCKEIGMEVVWDREANTMKAVTKEVKSCYIPLRFSGSNRIPILMMGALLGRTRENIVIPTVGGCKIGKRPVDFHLMALEKLGAKVEYRMVKKESAYFARAKEGLKGTVITLPYPSVMATENSILAACRAKGRTVIKNAAVEPEVIDLILFLQKLGAIIRVDVDRTIYVQEMMTCYPVEHTILTDRIEAACLGMAAISTKGRVFVEGANQADMITFLNKLREINGGFLVKEGGIEFFYQGPLKGGVHIETDVHPGFLTDWQQPFVILLTQAEGSSVMHETVHENRFGYIKTLKTMGADVELFTQCLGDRQCRFINQNHRHSLIVKGPTPFHADTIEVPDLRAGFAYVMAALIAPDTSFVFGLPYLDRGYENIDGKLRQLGADIDRVAVSSPPKEAEKTMLSLSPRALPT